MFAGCSSCSHLTRARAFDWLGQPNIIPIRHSAHWLRDDLAHTIRALAPGESVVVDYAGEVPDAPSFVFEHRPDGEFSAATPGSGWSWRGSEQERVELVVFSIVTYLRDRRGAHGVILIPPQV